MLTRTSSREVRFLSPKGNEIIGEASSLYERGLYQKVHLKEAPDEPCKVCRLSSNSVWMTSSDRFNQHVARCGTYEGGDE